MATKKAPSKSSAKKTTTKKTSKKAPAVSQYTIKESFRPTKNNPPFFTFKITIQTIYWTILVAVIIFLQLMIIKEQIKAAEATQQATRVMQIHKSF